MIISKLTKNTEIDEEELKGFCKNWYTLERFRYRSLQDEFESLKEEFTYESEPTFGWYFVIRATDEFI